MHTTTKMEYGADQTANRAAKFLKRFATKRVKSPSIRSSPKRASFYDKNSDFSPSPAAPEVDDHSADYWAMHLELQDMHEKCRILRSTTDQELYHARMRVEEADVRAEKAVEQKRKVEAEAMRQLEEARAYSSNLNASLEEERKKVQGLLAATKQLEESMRAKRTELMAEVKFQEKRAEDIRVSGVRLQLLAEETLRDAGEQTAEANRQVEAMQKSLIMARAYKLHTALEQITTDFTSRENKLKRMIAHLQADKAVLVSNMADVEKERESFKEHLRAVLAEPPAPAPAPALAPATLLSSPARSVSPELSASSRPSSPSWMPPSKRQEQTMLTIRSAITGEVLAVKIVERQDDIKAIRSVNGEILAVKIQ